MPSSVFRCSASGLAVRIEFPIGRSSVLAAGGYPCPGGGLYALDSTRHKPSALTPAVSGWSHTRHQPTTRAAACGPSQSWYAPYPSSDSGNGDTQAESASALRWPFRTAGRTGEAMLPAEMLDEGQADFFVREMVQKLVPSLGVVEVGNRGWHMYKYTVTPAPWS